MPTYAPVPISFSNASDAAVRTGVTPSGTDALTVARGLAHLLGYGGHLGTCLLGQEYTAAVTNTYRVKYMPKANFGFLVLRCLFWGQTASAGVTVTSGATSRTVRVSRTSHASGLMTEAMLTIPVAAAAGVETEFTFDVAVVSITAGGSIFFESFDMYDLPNNRIAVDASHEIVSPTTVAAGWPIYSPTTNPTKAGVHGLVQQTRQAFLDARRTHVVWSVGDVVADCRVTTSDVLANMYGGLSRFWMWGRQRYNGDDRCPTKVAVRVALEDTVTAGATIKLTGTRTTLIISIPTGTAGFFWVSSQNFDIDTVAEDEPLFEFKSNVAGKYLRVSGLSIYEPRPT